MEKKAGRGLGTERDKKEGARVRDREEVTSQSSQQVIVHAEGMSQTREPGAGRTLASRLPSCPAFGAQAGCAAPRSDADPGWAGRGWRGGFVLAEPPDPALRCVPASRVGDGGGGDCRTGAGPEWCC